MSRLRRPAVNSRERLRKLADEELMELVARNDSDAFEVVLERHSGAAMSLAYRMVGRRGPAEDVVQEAFLSLWRSGGRYDRTRGSVRNWALGIVHNRAIDTLRRDGARAARNVSDDGLEERLQAPDQTDVQAARRDGAQEIRSAVDQLPEDQRRVIDLAYFAGFTHTEIAAVLDLPLGTVKGRMRLGLAKLRGQLRDREAFV
jgi:RNA polymerase sigma-70 factor (ECF subfamily)